MNNLLAASYAVLKRDLRLAVRRRAEIFNPIIFYVLIVSLFPLGLQPDPALLAEIAPGVIWIGALLASLLALDNLFRSDFTDGTLVQIVVSPQPLPLLVLAKVVAHWLLSGLPLLLVAPVLGGMMGMQAWSLMVLIITLALGTPLLSLIGAIGVALTVGLQRGGALLALLVVPLFVPVLIFGAGSVTAAAQGLPVAAAFYFLGALLALAITFAPFAIAAALKASLE